MQESVYVCERDTKQERMRTQHGMSGRVFLKTCKPLLAIFIPSVADFEQHLPRLPLKACRIEASDFSF